MAGISGEPGSFLTTIFGGGLEGLELPLRGEDLVPAFPLGLPLADRCAVVLGVPAGADGALRCADGEGMDAEADLAGSEGGGRSEANEDLSWGAGEGAIAMTALIIAMSSKLRLRSVKWKKAVCKSVGGRLREPSGSETGFSPWTGRPVSQAGG